MKRRRSFTYIQTFHIHTHPARGRVVCMQWGEDEDEKGKEDEMKVKMRWKIT